MLQRPSERTPGATFALGFCREMITGRHYTRTMPSGKTWHYVHDGAVVLFSIPPNKNVSRWLLGEDNAVLELSRLWAVDGHRPNLLTQAIAAAVSALRPVWGSKVKALISYADPNVGHLGGVYRAASWIYLGQCEESRHYRDVAGNVVARRKFHSGKKFLLKAEIEALGYREVKLPGKHRFARGLTRQARKLVADKQAGA
jgi:hypothetical protein